ncbi:MAG: hypothetical protein EDM74_07750 [Armatimonadetes bacterium]|nr:MAG: hypothetical protein EDM74_07750 [Armatimonadota bacterium]
MKRALVIALFGLIAGSWAQDVENPRCDVELLLERTTVAPGEAFWVGVRFRIEPQWHIYWLNPGDSGIPTTLQWELPPGFAAGPIEWPTPLAFRSSGITSYGYANDVILLTKITVAADAAIGRSELAANVGWLICKENCMVGSAKVSRRVEVAEKTGPKGPESRWLESVAEKLPVSGKVAAGFTEDPTSISLDFRGVPDPAEIVSVKFFSQTSQVIDYSGEQKMTVREGEVQVSIPKSQFFEETPKVLKGVLYVRWKTGRSAAYAIEAKASGGYE